ncbi:hypothetical protein HYH03_018556 [Edaphochlamys debaryana]|uniref:Uncharacterized protein n=1 Tax=Edaphochlamys debaryana TaxID=47281 RepID=A0A835XHP0_9CHLO|nr:hypothetical protein HYH03_018556 [Edaphochlamys debaryana]|eukprot:KAG2482511.1 hypothetical protein HYH03_018556 [Edaphochlamys debaryana]
MAYAAKYYQRTWTYDPQADDHNARVGRILAGGLDLQASMRTKALAEVANQAAFEVAEKANQATNYVAAHMNDVPGMNAHVPDSRKPGGADGKGYMWVDPKGRPLGPVGSGAEGEGASTSGGGTGVLTGKRPQMTERQAEWAGMEPVERSMHMWRRVNPGCVRETTKLPVSTFKDHFGPKSRTGVEVPDKEFHLKKTDFSEYTEVKVRVMNQLGGKNN